MTQITISIPTPLRTYTNQLKRIEILNKRQVVTALNSLVEKYPKLEGHLFEDKKLRKFVNVYLNDEDIRYLELKEHSILRCGDTLSIIPALAGGVV